MDLVQKSGAICSVDRKIVDFVHENAHRVVSDVNGAARMLQYWADLDTVKQHYGNRDDWLNRTWDQTLEVMDVCKVTRFLVEKRDVVNLPWHMDMPKNVKFAKTTLQPPICLQHKKGTLAACHLATLSVSDEPSPISNDHLAEAPPLESVPGSSNDHLAIAGAPPPPLPESSGDLLTHAVDPEQSLAERFAQMMQSFTRTETHIEHVVGNKRFVMTSPRPCAGRGGDFEAFVNSHGLLKCEQVDGRMSRWNIVVFEVPVEVSTVEFFVRFGAIAHNDEHWNVMRLSDTKMAAFFHKNGRPQTSPCQVYCKEQ